MTNFKNCLPRMSRRTQLGAGAAVMLALGAAGGAGAMSLTRPVAQMAPTVQTAIAKLPGTEGIVTVRGQVADVYGDRFVVQDRTGRTMVDAGRQGAATVSKGQALLVQGRYDDGQIRASYLVGPDGKVDPVGPIGPHGRHGPPDRMGPDRPHGPADRDGPDARGPDAPPPPPPGGALRATDAGPAGCAPRPAMVGNAVPAAPAGTLPTPPAPPAWR